MATAIEAPRDKIYLDVFLAARKSCYKERDAFYECLEGSRNKPTDVASVVLLYRWIARKLGIISRRVVKHFDRQYCAKKRVQRLLEDNSSS
ncbi:hypothetical protein AKJ16_DCAP08494 [Drosera capensis]